MSIEINQPEIEALIQRRMESGAFQDAEEVLLYALKSSPLQNAKETARSRRTGADLVSAMQAMPFSEIDLDPFRPVMPVRDVTL